MDEASGGVGAVDHADRSPESGSQNASHGTPGPTSRRGWALLYLALLVFAPAISLAVMVWWPADELSPATVAPDEPATTVLQTREVTDARRVAVDLVWSPPSQAVATGPAGGVSSVVVGAGDDVSTGTPVLTVDGVQVRALASDVAVTTPVGEDSPAALVRAVSELFVAVGVRDEPSDVWDADMRTALGDYLDLVRAPDADVLDPGLLVWLPHEPFPVGEVAARVGAPMPAPGEPVLTGPPALETVRRQQSDGAEGTPGIAMPSNPYVARFEGVELGPWPLGGTVPDATLAALAEVVAPGTESVVVDLATRDPIDLVAAPSSAILTDQDGTLCVVPADGDPVPVEPLRSSGDVIEFLPIEGVREVMTVASEAAESC